MKTTIAHALLPAAALCCAGCMTDFMQESRDQNQRTQTDVSYLKQDIDVLRQRLDALERNQEDVLGRVDAAVKFEKFGYHATCLI